MKTLFELAISYLSRNFDAFAAALAALPPNCKETIIDWLCSHDLLEKSPLLTDAQFLRNLTVVQFFLSDQVTDEVLRGFGEHNDRLSKIVLVHCAKVTDNGIVAVTRSQSALESLELRGLKSITSKSLACVHSSKLGTVDLSDCAQICSAGLVDLLSRNPTVRHLILNNCKSLDDVALYAIASYCGARLQTLELDFLSDLIDPSTAIAHLTTKCCNLHRLSLCRYFGDEHSSVIQNARCRLQCVDLRELDLYGNYFNHLPIMPPNITQLRLSCTGEENVVNLTNRLAEMGALQSIRLVVVCPDGSDESGMRTSAFLCHILEEVGDKVTGLQVHCDQLRDDVLRSLDSHCVTLTQLCVDADTVSSRHLSRLLSRSRERAAGIRSLKLSRCNITWRALYTIARYCPGLVDLEMSYMLAVDDRFLRLLADHATGLVTINFNGCKWVHDRGLCALARQCPRLSEVRVRATSITDACVYCLAQFCPQLEWIAHADYTGRPKFSPEALQALKDSCNSRVIC